MNKDIEKMLKYQKVDMQLYILDKKLKNAEETKKMMEATTRRKASKDDYINVSRDIDNEMVSVSKAESDFQKLLLEANDLENSIADNANIEQIDYFLKKVDDLLKKIKDVENIGGDSKRALEKLNETAESDLNQVAKYTQVVAKYKPQFEELKEKMLVEANKIKAELNKVIKDENIDTESKVYKVYKNTSKHRMPVFVELNERNCGGCGVEVPNNVINVTNDQGYAECPNCGRILYKR